MRGSARKIHGMTFEEYQALEGVNWSTLKYIVTESPGAYKHMLAHPIEDNPRMWVGRGAHTAILEPDRLLAEYVEWEHGRKSGEKWETFLSMHPGKTVLKPEEFGRVLGMRDAVRRNRDARRVMARGRSEVVLQWRDPQTGIVCKCRIDRLAPRYATDLKTTSSIDDHDFTRRATMMHYHGQLGFYDMGLDALGLEREWWMVVVEQEPFHDCGAFQFDEDVLYAGAMEAREALDILRVCRDTRRWPGRYAGAQRFVLPNWYFKSEQEIEDRYAAREQT